MVSRTDKVARFRALHASGCFVMPNVWDVAGARMTTGLGFEALATTSSGHAHALGMADGAGEVRREDSLAHAAEIAASTPLPVTADLEDGYEDTPEGVFETVRLAAEAGLAGLSIEDRRPDAERPIREFEDAAARVEAAAVAARRHDIVLTARADGLGQGVYGLDEAIRRLRAFEALGAEVVYAPGVPDLASLKTLCGSVRAPVNHVIGQGAAGLGFEEIAGAGVRRISLGGSLARAVGGAMLDICREIAAGDFAALDGAPAWSRLRAPEPARHARTGASGQ